METVKLDIRGQICPSTLLTTLRAVNAHRVRLRAGEVCLVVLTDNRDSTATIPEALTNMGYPSSVSRDGRHYAITVGSEAP